MRRRAAMFAVLLGLAECTQAADLDAARQAIAISAQSVDLVAGEPDRTRIGDLTFLGGFALTADHPAFGGLSGLWVAPDGRRFLAVTDRGNWVEATLTGDPTTPDGVADGEIGPLGTPAGGRIADARGRDAEAVVRLSDGRMLVAFEGEHRVLSYPADGDPPLAKPAARIPTPDLLAKAPGNKGPEALATLADGRLLLLTEGLTLGNSRIGFLRHDDRWRRVRYPLDPDYAPTDAARLPNGDVLVLERRFDPLGGFQIRLRRLPGGTIKPAAMLDGPIIAHFRPPYTVDNYEGLAVRTAPDGRTLIYIVADDNFQPLQRTLLLVFALDQQ